jgi:hypothetical protein
MKEKELFAEVEQFVALQKALVDAWRHACEGCRDIKALVDFPWRIEVVGVGRTWAARKHGVGVKFEGGEFDVDVPHHVWETDWFESDRIYDYLRSRGLLDLVDPAEKLDRREMLFELFSQWAERGLLCRMEDEIGRALYSLVRADAD